LLETARAGQSVLVSLADERDVCRGDVIVAADALGVEGAAASAESGRGTPRTLQVFKATACWLNERPLTPGQPLLLQHLTRSVKARVQAVDEVLDVRTHAWSAPWSAPAAGSAVGLNDIFRLQLATQQPLWAEPYRVSRAAGAFILVDPVTRETVAAGLTA
jgi:sulfate adenylyltransferase subunit 1 (EFTu-like GTPase family)